MGTLDHLIIEHAKEYDAEQNVGFKLVVVQPEMHDEDRANWWDAALRLGEIEVTGLGDLIDVAERACVRAKKRGKAGKIRELTISGHGNSGGFYVGNDWIDLESIVSYAGAFARLSKSLAPKASVRLQHCEVGRDEPLLIVLSGFLGGASVSAGLNDQGPTDELIGDTVECVFVRGCKHTPGLLNFVNGKKIKSRGK